VLSFPFWSPLALDRLVWTLAVLVQIVIAALFPVCAIPLDTPSESEQPFRHSVVCLFGILSTPLSVIGLPHCQTMFVSASIASNTFAALFSSTGSVACALFVSFVLLCDQATLDLVDGDRGVGPQFWLARVCLAEAEGLPSASLMSLSAVVVACSVMVALLIRLAVWPFALPLLTLVAVALRKSPAVSLVALAGLALAGSGGWRLTVDRFRCPTSCTGAMTVAEVIDELIAHKHNLVQFGLVPLATFAWTVNKGKCLWVLNYVLAAVVVIHKPISCAGNGATVRVVYAKYLVLLACGLLICREPASHFLAPAVGGILAIAFMCYVMTA
jgi:hypothetical protein